MTPSVTTSGHPLPETLTSRQFLEVAVLLANAQPDDLLVLVNGRATLLGNRLTYAAFRADEFDRNMALLFGAENPPPVDPSQGCEVTFIGSQPDDQVRAAKQLQRNIAAAMYAVIEGTDEYRERWGRAARAGLREVDVVTQLQLAPSGRLGHVHRYQPRTDKAVIGLLYAFLLDPDQKVGERLRLCSYAGCSKFFLDDFGDKGGGVRRYCDEHREAAQREANAARQREFRKRRKQARKAK